MSEESTFNHIFQTKTIPPFLPKNKTTTTYSTQHKTTLQKHIISIKFKWKFVVSCAQTTIKSSCW